ncbi:recombinase family protein (plasmid) [Acinetobacter sp. NEB149]|uniref:recombinase family protein n=1 Tax=Acinetobacter sp. NEB149 TaxID=2725684 RepID=UPI001448B479|nr:recombinase family protein [Acinetobacter sp. NEB149]QJB50209.1 recombinase family protein [Acinetobacter sp. NEB149]
MVGKKIGYKRVSTAQQKHDRQLDGIALDKEYVEIASGSKTDRPKLNEMLDYVREGDIVYVHSLDRLGRDALHTINTIEAILKKEASLVFVNENLTLDPNANDPMKKMLLAVFSYFAEFEKKLSLNVGMRVFRLPKEKDYIKGNNLDTN